MTTDKAIVTVKPLEWRNLYPESTKWPKIWHGKGAMSSLYTCEQYGPAYGWFTKFGSFTTLEFAKAAAQSDYETRILSALSHTNQKTEGTEGEDVDPPAPVQHVVGDECRYATDQGMLEHRCAVRCVYEEKGFSAAIEQAAQVAERYDETDTLSASKAIALAIRALTTEGRS